MEYREIKHEFLKTKLFGTSGDFGMVPERIYSRWEKRWDEVPQDAEIPKFPRLINHCTVGADPEFSVRVAATGELVPADKFHLHAGRAFGADNNGRLVELRPTPSRFVLDVIASMLAELQWMARIVPRISEFQWISLPYDKQDGLGGHVHFARKRSTDAMIGEVDALDSICRIGEWAGLFNMNLCMARRERAPGHYGRYGDIRYQKHGYEYRSFPTWLNSPWMAYLSLVLAKLAVYDPRLCNELSRRIMYKELQGDIAIKNLLKFYQNQDDDARIAYAALKRLGLPTHKDEDFKSAWGINGVAENANLWYPDMIPPTEEYRSFLFKYLVNGTPIPFVLSSPNWLGSQIPKGYSSLFHTSRTLRRPGIGEICSNLVYHDSCPVSLEVNESTYNSSCNPSEGNYFREREIYRIFSETFGSDHKLSIRSVDSKGIYFYFSKVLRKPESIKRVKQFLLRVAPCWESHLVTPESFPKWVAEREKRFKEKSEYKGSEIV